MDLKQIIETSMPGWTIAEQQGYAHPQVIPDAVGVDLETLKRKYLGITDTVKMVKVVQNDQTKTLVVDIETGRIVGAQG